MQKDFYNQNNSTQTNDSDPNSFLKKLFTAPSSVNLFCDAQNLSSIINVSETKKRRRSRKKKEESERSRIDSVRISESQDLNSNRDLIDYARDRLDSSKRNSVVIDNFASKNNNPEIESFIKLPVKKARNEIIRQPEALENQNLVDIGLAAFESDSENIETKDIIFTQTKDLVCFVKRESLEPLRLIKKPKGRIFDLLDFIQRRDDKTRQNTVYACKYCPKVYAKRAALGGHTAKNHPHLSDSYKVRQLSMNGRKIEKERFDFFKKL